MRSVLHKIVELLWAAILAYIIAIAGYFNMHWKAAGFIIALVRINALNSEANAASEFFRGPTALEVQVILG